MSENKDEIDLKYCYATLPPLSPLMTMHQFNSIVMEKEDPEGQLGLSHISFFLTNCKGPG